jgi:hypothetical protein
VNPARHPAQLIENYQISRPIQSELLIKFLFIVSAHCKIYRPPPTVSTSRYKAAAQNSPTVVLPTAKSKPTSRTAGNLNAPSLTSLLLRHLPPSPPPETRNSQPFSIPSLCVWCKVSPQFETRDPQYDRSLFCSKACHSLAQATAQVLS